MSVVSTFLLAVSMSADAFAVSLARGTCCAKPRLIDAAKTGVVFGGVEACAPVVGWLIGLVASGFIQSIDHWVAFTILGVIGVKMIFESVWGGAEDVVCDVTGSSKTASPTMLALTAVGTSMDSMAVGVSLAFINADILVSALSIGMATFTMSTLGTMIGHKVGSKLGRFAEIAGGLCLIAIGTRILMQHLAGLA